MVEQSRQLKPIGRAGVIGACVFVLVLIAGMEVQTHREEKPASDPQSLPISPRTAEGRLAAIQLGRPLRWQN